MPKLKTTIEIRDENFSELEVEIYFDYQKAEQATQNYPGCPEQICVGDIIVFSGLEEKAEDLIWANRDSWEED